MLLNSMASGKRYFGEKLFDMGIGYLKKEPEKNLVKLLELIEKAPVAEHHKDYARTIKEAFENNPAIKQYFARVFNELDDNVRSVFLPNLFVNASLVGVPLQKECSEKLGCSVPYTILIDPTSNCNLSCRGCWAGAYTRHRSLEFEEMDRIVTEAKELGIYFIVLSGGEPLLWPHLPALCRKHNDVAFMAYTNGTLIDKKAAEWMKEAGNFSPAISLEGGRSSTDLRRGEGVYDRIMQGMDLLREHGVAFGFSVTATRLNCEEILSDDFIDLMIEKGALYGWSFHYIPIGSSPDFSMVLEPKQRSSMVDRIRHIRSSKPILIVDFWNDGHLTGGCIAGGKRYFHINASGDVEPCAFVHFSVGSIKKNPLTDILRNPLFKAYQEEQPFCDNLLRPCPIIDCPDKLRSMVSDTGAKPTHHGADSILCGENARMLDDLASRWKAAADARWAGERPEGEAETMKS